ncbi:methionyl-tRNA formyltransferase [Sulfurimonas hydrogeniphila]|uniref:methionyl-tRNA formyltransferase n=1 Tax=Sulfurimonas hydrogeniphila TaxID=2509341 RepID=UPI00125F0C21|nr:methionyl-tRNA formyltransferase [Sulfurimonas hydrogeniphila]
MKDTIIIATIKEWNIKQYFLLAEKYKNKFDFMLITTPKELNYEELKKIKPKYIFFPHWSWLIPKEIYENFESILFHMTDLPFGRGGSPFQNLIMSEIYETKVSAIRVEEGLDTGNIYLKEPFNISLGSAEENFIELSNIIFNKMIPQFLNHPIKSIPQKGKITKFKRRTPNQSNILNEQITTMKKMYDFIRMLDAEGYPKAYIEVNNLKIEFSEVHLKKNELVGRFEVKENE